MVNANGWGFSSLQNAKISVAHRRRHGSLEGEVVYTIRMEAKYNYADEYIGHWPVFDWHPVGPIPEGCKVLEVG